MGRGENWSGPEGSCARVGRRKPVSLREFQRAMCDLIADPELCLHLRRDPGAVLERYDLDGRERRRLRDVVGQPGMSVNCTLYRANRIMPLRTMLPHSCKLLGDRFVEEADAFWRANTADMHFGPEVEGFAEFLRGRVASRKLQDPFLIETLEFELAFNDLRLVSRRRLLAELGSRRESGSWVLNPLVRVVPFSHDPGILLAELAEGRVPASLPRGNFYLVVDARDPQLALKTISPRFGRALTRAAPDAPLDSNECSDLGALIEGGLLVPV